MPSTSEPRWVTVSEAAARLRVCPDTVYALIRERCFTTRRQGRRHLIEASSIDAYERATQQLSRFAAQPASGPVRSSKAMPHLGILRKVRT